MLLGGAAAAITVPVATGALLTRERSGASAPAASADAAPPAPAAAPFEDVAADHPGASAMLWAHETGVQPASTETAYRPDAEVSRGDLALALHRLAGAPEVSFDAASAVLVDLGADGDRAAAQLWLHGRGVLWGDAELRVRPEDPATRADAAALLTALLRPALAGFGAVWEIPSEVALPEGTEPGSVLRDVAWLAAAGIGPAAEDVASWSGDPAVTRAELAQWLHRADGAAVDASS
ncbi:S-layer homology domain-containing protein [Brachybacterium sp. YJGR34]|uniref:S-layer homology domain-containing protein n=1 Tax=Brachybacterium sp. YJGR34 TaxID=2059911 RepID=UPI000E0B6550|nr:S-layer homology domain-containing protein [Brachybacterium sp. YJGR34]